MAPPSLVSLCTKVCIKNISSLTDVGDFEYWKIEHILKHVKSADQLQEIEVNCPQIKGEDAELWKVFIADVDAKWYQKNYIPRDPTKWYEIYRKYKREAEEKLRRDEENLRAAMLGLNKEKESHTSVLVSSKALPRLPRDPRMRPNNGGVPLGRGKGQQRTANESVLTWGGGSKTKTTDPKSVLLKARREAKEMSMRSRLGVPANQLKSRSVIQQAPASMVDEYRRAAISPLKIYAPKTPKTATTGVSYPVRDSVQEAKERRLRALTTGKNQGVQRVGTVVPRFVSDNDSSSCEEGIAKSREPKTANTIKTTVVLDDEDSDIDDLFDEQPVQPRKRVMQPPARRATPTSKPQEARNSKPPARISSSTTKAIKPSDLISSLVSKPTKLIPNPSSKPEAREPLKPSPPRACPATNLTSASPTAKSVNPGQRPSSPTVQVTAKPMVRKKAPVDIFNRQVKRPRRA